MSSCNPVTAEQHSGPSSNSIRVLQIIDSLVAGGKERQFIELLKGLKLRPEINCLAVVLSDLIQYQEIHTSELDCVIMPRRSQYDLSVFPQLYRLLRDFRPDVVHSWNSMCSVYAAPIAKLLGAKFVNGYIRSAPRGLNSLNSKHYFRGKLTWSFSDAIVSNTVAGLAAYGVKSPKGVCIYNGFDLHRLDHLEHPSEMRTNLEIGTPHVVGMVGRFTPAKDYATFVGAAERILDTRNDVTFLAVGDGPDLSRIRAGVSPEKHRYIKFPGNRSDVESIVNIFSVGVLTSSQVYGEGISNALMEYMALAKPVIATDCAGNRELIEHGGSGYLVAGGGVTALKNYLVKLLDDPALALRLGESGRRTIRDQFSLERMTHTYIRLYREILRTRTM